MARKKDPKAREKITVTVDKELNEQWNRVAKSYGWTKSRMLDDLLREVLPVLDQNRPEEVLSKGLEKLGKSFSDVSKLIK